MPAFSFTTMAIRLLAVIVAVFLLPAGIALGLWSVQERPGSWRDADWSSAGLLSREDRQPAFYVMAARTGGLKGAISVHSWIVMRRAGEENYTRFDKVGWGRPVRVNGWAADARWYSNEPQILAAFHGTHASAIIDEAEKAIARYPYRSAGDYRIWPGPNSNSFVAHILREVPQIGIVLPPEAIGRDFVSANRIVSLDRDRLDLHLSFRGLIGFSVGVRSGIEFHLLGLVAGIDILRPALKLPGIGRLGWS